ncbi:MAG: hypothetical protein LBB60_09805 [Desulfovibrio sp.]|nr:hypothetical protein [Desulfovibrio sp.]
MAVLPDMPLSVLFWKAALSWARSCALEISIPWRSGCGKENAKTAPFPIKKTEPKKSGKTAPPKGGKRVTRRC